MVKTSTDCYTVSGKTGTVFEVSGVEKQRLLPF